MKKQLLSIGKVLSKAEQKTINGGYKNCNDPDQCDCFVNLALFCLFQDDGDHVCCEPGR
ncbi:hypothetical protein [Kordia sp.]|uniref:hypothetical protein n=1 Tax=Kordia sp. TaxID=1965332 RepID=UPI003D6BFFC3